MKPELSAARHLWFTYNTHDPKRRSWDASIYKSPSANAALVKARFIRSHSAGGCDCSCKRVINSLHLWHQRWGNLSGTGFGPETYLNPSCCIRWPAPIAFCSAQPEASSPSSSTSTRSSTRFPSTGNNSTPQRSVYHSASLSSTRPHAAFSSPSSFLLSYLSRTF